MRSLLTKAGGWLKGRPRGDVVIPVVLFAVVLITWLPRLRGPIDLRWDAGVYYVLGTSLAEGKGYKLLNEPGEIEATQYPPLLPAFIAACHLILGTSDPIVVGKWLRRVFFLISLLYIFVIYLMSKIYLPSGYAFLTTLVCLVNHQTNFLTDLCFPEIPFALTTTLFVICNRKKAGRIYPLLSALFAVASFALRTIGIALLAAWVAESLFNREFKKTLLRAAVSLMPILCWQFYISSVETGYQYQTPPYAYQRADYLYYNVSYAKNTLLIDPFSPELGYLSCNDMAVRFLGNLTEMPKSVGGAVTSTERIWTLQRKTFERIFSFPIEFPWAVDFLLIMIGCLIFGGVGLQLANRQWFIPFYVLLSVAAICLTPWPTQFSRYLAPLAPFLALSLFQLLFTLKEQSYSNFAGKWKYTGSVFAGSLVSLILFEQLVTLFLVYSKWHQRVVYHDRNGQKSVYRLFFYHDPHRALDAALDWLNSRAKSGEVVASSMPHWVYLRTGLKSVMPPFERDPDKAQDLLDSVPVKYLLLDVGLALETRKYTSPVVQNFPGQWKRLYSDTVMSETGEVLEDRFEIYQRVAP